MDYNYIQAAFDGRYSGILMTIPDQKRFETIINRSRKIMIAIGKSNRPPPEIADLNQYLALLIAEHSKIISKSIKFK
jgi:hypothetical protein